MKILRSTIRNILIKEARCAEATKKIQSGIDFLYANKMHLEYYRGYFGDLEIRLYKEHEPAYEEDGYYYEAEYRQFGLLDAYKQAEEPCYVLSYAGVHPDLQGTGLGALLYEVAIELVTRMGSYLACDRETVSSKARKMWRYFASSDDYEALQLDLYPFHYDRKVFLTPEEDDDMNQEIFFKISGAKIEEPTFRKEFLSSPFTKAYRKKRITTLPCLEKGKLKEVY